jgi:hypothetical protein
MAGVQEGKGGGKIGLRQAREARMRYARFTNSSLRAQRHCARALIGWRSTLDGFDTLDHMPYDVRKNNIHSTG